MENRFLFVITGPTGVGKTKLSIDIAQHFDAEIFSCDSRQFYKETNIGTAKPTKQDLSQVRHHFINILSIEQDYSAGQYEKDIIPALEQYYHKKSVAILCGGTGLFIKAAVEGLDDFPDIPQRITDALEISYKEKGLEFLQSKLLKADPEYFKTVDHNNPRRLIRALSVIEFTSEPFSSFLNRGNKKRIFTPIYIVLNRERSELYERINQRVDEMLDNGLLEEAQKLYKFRSNKSMQTLGYQEIFQYLSGNIELEDAIDLIKRNSRRYAKRQLTWFRKIANANWFHPDQKVQIIEFLERSIS